ncbi:MAG: glucosaminidase domain-containing protein [Arachidicoccus sp.]|nr:glucosaminidase domain-containing protein [Arachidicoccus sp.]
MRKLILLLLPGMLTAQAFAQTSKVMDYISRYKNIAMSEMLRTGVPAAITLAQGILESGCGQSELARESNNHFGIKCKTEWRGPKTYHDDDSRQECFRVYQSPEDSYRDHSDFLKNRPYYTNLFSLNPLDYSAWAYGLKKDGYATERDYPTNLIRIIETYHLEDYSELALNGKYKDASSENYALNNKLDEADMNASASVKSSDVNIPVRTIAETPKMRVAQTMVALPAYPASPFFINNTKVVYAPKGASLLALASKYKVDYNKLLKLNDMKDVNILPEAKIVYLQKKSDKGDKKFYIASYGETLKDVSDKEAVELKKLVEYNHIAPHEKLEEGQKVILRKDNASIAWIQNEE